MYDVYPLSACSWPPFPCDCLILATVVPLGGGKDWVSFELNLDQRMFCPEKAVECRGFWTESNMRAHTEVGLGHTSTALGHLKGIPSYRAIEIRVAEADWEQLRVMLTSVPSPLPVLASHRGVIETLLCNLTSYASWFVCFETGSNSRLSWNSLCSPRYNSTLVTGIRIISYHIQ